MRIARVPRGRGWTFVVDNDGDRAIDEVVVESVDYEWGDAGSGTSIGKAFGPIAPGARVAVHDEDDTEVRTSLTVRVREGAVEARWIAEAGRLYAPRSDEPIDVPIESAPAPPGTIELDLRGVRRWKADGTAESARWDRLVAIEIVTTSGGPVADDVLWVLHEDTGGCVVPSTAEPAEALVARVTALPGFDHQAMIAAMACAEDARFLVWRRKPQASS